MISNSQEDKINFVKDDMSKELLHDNLRSLETHRSRHVSYEIHGNGDYSKNKVHNLLLGI